MPLGVFLTPPSWWTQARAASSCLALPAQAWQSGARPRGRAFQPAQKRLATRQAPAPDPRIYLRSRWRCRAPSPRPTVRSPSPSRRRLATRPVSARSSSAASSSRRARTGPRYRRPARQRWCASGAPAFGTKPRARPYPPGSLGSRISASDLSPLAWLGAYFPADSSEQGVRRGRAPKRNASASSVRAGE